MTLAAPKLTKAEGLALVAALERLCGASKLVPAIIATLPPAKAVALVVNREAVALTKAETAAMVKAIVPLIPGATLKDKVLAATTAARPAFASRERFKEVLAYIVARLRGQPKDTPAAGVKGVDQRLGYGAVNNWRAIGLPAIVDATARAGIGIVAIEFFEWQHGRFDDVRGQLVAFGQAIEPARRNGQILYVCLVNSNLGSKKYGDPGVKLSKYDQAIMAAAAQFASWMQTHKHIYVTPVNEGGLGPDKAYDQRLQTWCKAHMPASQLVNNWCARPTGNAGMGQRCVHPGSLKDIGTGNAWVMSDHGDLIRALNGGALYGTANVAITEDYARRVTAAGRKFIFYHFDRQAKIDANALKALAAVAKPQATAPAQPASGDEIDIKAVRFLHTNVSAWPATAKLTASIAGGQIRFPYDKANVWPVANSGLGNGTNGNVWAIVKINGEWVAATFEWLRPGQTAKPVGVLDGSKGDHFKVAPLNRWRPSSGERFGIMVSGLARTAQRTVQERSNVAMVRWP